MNGRNYRSIDRITKKLTLFFLISFFLFFIEWKILIDWIHQSDWNFLMMVMVVIYLVVFIIIKNNDFVDIIGIIQRKKGYRPCLFNDDHHHQWLPFDAENIDFFHLFQKIKSTKLMIKSIELVNLWWPSFLLWNWYFWYL